MEKIRPNAAGIDIGSEKVFVAIEGQPVKSFLAFTSDLHGLKDYLKGHNITTVAMEATGIYWVIVYEILEQSGLDVWLVDGRETKQVPGRKTDVKDCQWILQLHSYGLLNRCFVPDELIKKLRTYKRLREDHIQSGAMHINHMQKALTAMNIRLPQVLSQVNGKSGLRIIQAILSGERDKEKLLDLCDGKIKATKADQVLKALEGYYTEPQLFALQQAYDGYLFYQEQIKACDEKIKAALDQITADKKLPPDTEVRDRKPIRHNKPQIKDLGTLLIKAFDGKDASMLSGVSDYTWLKLLAEIGTDLSRWATEKHFTSWLGLAPGQNNSGKKRRTKRRGRPKAGQIFREIAQSIMNSKYLAWGHFARRLRGRKSSAVAIKATARKIAAQYWRLITHGSEFVEKGIEQYKQTLQQQKLKQLNRLALELKVDIQGI